MRQGFVQIYPFMTMLLGLVKRRADYMSLPARYIVTKLVCDVFRFSTTSGWLSDQCVRLSCGRWWVFARLSHTKDHHKNVTNCLLTWQACIRVGVRQCSSTVLKAGKCAELSIRTCTKNISCDES